MRVTKCSVQEKKEGIYLDEKKNFFFYIMKKLKLTKSNNYKKFSVSYYKNLVTHLLPLLSLPSFFCFNFICLLYTFESMEILVN